VLALLGKREAGKRPRWPYLPGQQIVLVAGLGIIVGTALPWAVVLGQSLWGSPRAIMWSFWAGLITVAASAVRWRPVALVSATAGGATAVFFAIWQTARIVDRCPFSLDCLPGPGLGFLLAGGGAALFWSARVVRRRA
jgi:hypothetical protein